MRSPEEDFLFDDETTEALAAYAHDAWAGWMRYLFSKCGQLGRKDDFRKVPEGAVVMPADYVRNIRKLIDTHYSELPEEQKEKDREEAAKILDIITERDP